jgi:hypothetical protein
MDLPEILAARGIHLAALGGAYLLLLANVFAAIALFMCARAYLVVSPNRAAQRYGLYVVIVLTALSLATVLENELVPQGQSTLQYTVLPQLILLLIVHLWIYYRQEPWLVTVGAATTAGAVVVIGIAWLVTDIVRRPHWLSGLLLIGMLGYLWRYSISTKRGFMKARSIYIESKEHDDRRRARPQTPWLGLPQWVALAGASLLVATLNAVLGGAGLAEVPAVDVLIASLLLLAATSAVCAIPAATYWLAHRRWMPELTRFVWLIWLVVGFAFTYSNYLTKLGRI